MSELASVDLMEKMLCSTVINLDVVEEGRVGGASGQLAHAAFLDILRQMDPKLSALLHAGNGLRPFTLSPLIGLTRGDGRVARGDRCRLRLTALDGRVFSAFLGRLVAGGVTPRIRLGSAEFAVREAITRGVDRWAGCDTWRGLLESGLSREIGLRFASPTAFSFGKRTVAMPVPELVFGGYLSKWNAFGPGGMGRELIDRVREQLVVSRYRLATQILEFDRYRQVGFVGVCWFEAIGAWTEEELRRLNALAAFSFYAGTGYKTTMGMGQTRRVVVGGD